MTSSSRSPENPLPTSAAWNADAIVVGRLHGALESFIMSGPGRALRSAQMRLNCKRS